MSDERRCWTKGTDEVCKCADVYHPSPLNSNLPRGFRSSVDARCVTEEGCKCPESYFQKYGTCLGWRSQTKCRSVKNVWCRETMKWKVEKK
jgi:hypothetical protein